MGGSIVSGHQRTTSAECFAAKSDLSIALLLQTDNLYTAMLLTVASVRDIPSCGVYSITSEMGNHISACTHARYIHNHALRLRGKSGFPDDLGSFYRSPKTYFLYFWRDSLDKFLLPFYTNANQRLDSSRKRGTVALKKYVRNILRRGIFLWLFPLMHRDFWHASVASPPPPPESTQDTPSSRKSRSNPLAALDEAAAAAAHNAGFAEKHTFLPI